MGEIAVMSLKDALEKAGFKGTQKSEKPKKTFKKREERTYQPRKKTHTHHKQRTTCDVCRMILPDVELFEHRNPAILHAKWICVSCADKNMIPDDQRRTAQSESSKQRMYRRYFGRTVKHIPNQGEAPNSNPGKREGRGAKDNRSGDRSGKKSFQNKRPAGKSVKKNY